MKKNLSVTCLAIIIVSISLSAFAEEKEMKPEARPGLKVIIVDGGPVAIIAPTPDTKVETMILSNAPAKDRTKTCCEEVACPDGSLRFCGAKKCRDCRSFCNCEGEAIQSLEGALSTQ